MPDGEAAATRREVDQLASRVDHLDTHGSRGMGVLQLQVTDLARSVGELKSDLDARFRIHTLQHEKDVEDHKKDVAARVRGRRWLAGIIVTVALALLGMFTSIMVVLISGGHVR